MLKYLKWDVGNSFCMQKKLNDASDSLLSLEIEYLFSFIIFFLEKIVE